MSTGICPIISRLISDLYLTAPEEVVEDMMNREDPDMWDVKLDFIYIEKRIYTCVDYVCRTLLPMALNITAGLEDIATKLKRVPEVQSVDDYENLLNLIYEAQDTLDLINSNETIPQSEEEAMLFTWMQEVTFSARWVVEAAMSGSSVVGPLTVNMLDILSMQYNWTSLVPHAERLIERMRKVELMVN